MIEQLARTSAEELRAGITTDVDAGLTDLYTRQARHRRRTRAGAAAAVVLALGVGWGAGAALTRHNDPDVGPSHQNRGNTYFHFPCQIKGVHCEGHRTYLFSLVRPVRWHVPPGFDVSFGLGIVPLAVEVDRADGRVAVSVLERVRASSPRGRAAPGVADDPHTFVQWVASRDFLDAQPVVRTEIDGHPAWQVQVTLAQGAGPGAQECDGNPCHLVTYQPDGGTAGIGDDVVAEYTAFRLPGAGTTVVWSRSSGDPRRLASVHEAVAGLSWPDG